ncbi:MFS transporter [Modestobacter sp. SYSU DS0511]
MQDSTRSPGEPVEFGPKGRRALGAAMFGFFVDMYDVYLPVIALSPAIVYFTSSGSSTVDMAIFTALIFVASIIGRPLGSVVFGPLGDRIGRRKTTLIAAAGSAVCTGAMAVLPGYATIGVWALVSLIFLRLVDGLFLGGEYSAANPLAMEYAPRSKRGVAGSMINMGYPLALAFITVVTLLTLRIFPAGGPESAYAVWGWRIPFLFGFVFCTALFFYYLKAVPESEIWTKMPKNRENPLKALASGPNARSFGIAFVVGSGAWLTLNGTVGVFSSHFRGLDVSDFRINVVILTAALLGAALFPVVGAAGQRFGRRETIMVIGAACAVVSTAALAFAVAAKDSTWMIPLAILAIIPGLTMWAMITAFLMELFPTKVRASGYGIAYSLPSIVPAFYAYYMVGLGTFMDYDYTPAVITAVGGVLLIVGGYVAKDLRDRHLGDF